MKLSNYSNLCCRVYRAVISYSLIATLNKLESIMARATLHNRQDSLDRALQLFW